MDEDGFPLERAVGQEILLLYTMGGWKENGCLKSEGEGGGRLAKHQEIYELCQSLVKTYEVS